MCVTDVVEVLQNSLGDVDDAYIAAPLLSDHHRVGLRAAGRAEAGHGAGDDIGGGKPHAPHRHGRYHDREGGVHAAGDADDAVVEVGVGHALDEAGNLDVQHPLAAGGQVGGVFGQVRMLVEAAGEGGVDRGAVPRNGGIVLVNPVEVPALAAEIFEVFHVDLRDGKAVLALGLGKNIAVFGNEAEAGIGIIGTALALAGGGEHHGGRIVAGFVLRVQFRVPGGVHGLREVRHLDDQRRACAGIAGFTGPDAVRIGAQLHGDAEGRQALAPDDGIGTVGHSVKAGLLIVDGAGLTVIADKLRGLRSLRDKGQQLAV